MSQTREVFFANPYQPAMGVAHVLDKPGALELLKTLSKPQTLAALQLCNSRRTLLYDMQRLGLVQGYRINEQVFYRLRRLPPRVKALLEAEG